MAEEFLDGANVLAGLEEVGGEGVAEGVAGDSFGEVEGFCGGADGALEDGFVEVVAAGLAGGLVEVGSCRGEGPLPGPFFSGIGVLAGEGAGEFDPAGSLLEVFLMLDFGFWEVGV